MTQLVPFQEARLPTVVQAKAAVDKAQTVDEVRQINSLFEAARVYASKMGDLYKQADAAEVKFYCDTRIGEMLAKQPKRYHRDMLKSGVDFSTIEELNAAGLSQRQLDKARKAYAIEDKAKHVAELRDRIINHAARKAAIETSKEFNQRSKVINMHIRQFLTFEEPVGRDLLEVISSIDKFDLPEDVEQIRRMQVNCEQLALRAANLARKLSESLTQREKIINE